MIRALLGQTALYGLSSIVGRLINFMLTPFLTRYFSDVNYGIYTEFYAFAVFFLIVFTYGLESSFFRFAKKENISEVYSTAFGSILISTLLFLILPLFFLQPIATSIGYGDQSIFLLCFLGIMASDALIALPFAKLRFEERALRFGLIKLMNIAMNLILVFFFLLALPRLASDNNALALYLYRPDFGIGYVFLANMIAGLITAFFLLPEISTFRTKHFSFTRWKEMLVFGIPLLFSGLAGATNESLDRIMLKRLLPGNETENLAQLGIYGACYRLSMFMTLSVQAFRMAAEPFFFKFEGQEKSGEVYARILRFFVITCCFIFLIITLYLDIFKYFIDSKMHGGLHVVPILLMANLFFGVFYNLTIWYKLTKQTMYALVLNLIGASITIGLNYWWIPIFGFTGSAWATLICYVVITLLCYLLGQKYYPIPYRFFRRMIYVPIVIIISGIAELLKSNLDLSVVNSLLINTLLLLFFASLVFLLERTTKKLT